MGSPAVYGGEDVTLVTAGAAVAAPGTAPGTSELPDEANEMSNDARDNKSDENATHGTDRAVEMSETDTAVADSAVERNENASAENGTVSVFNAQGSSGDLPEPVPDHEAQIHELIQQFLNDEYDGSLGGAIRNVTPSDESASGNAPTGSA